MKRYTIIILLIFTISVYGQDGTNNKPTTSLKRLLVGINFSPDLCYRTLKDNGDTIASAIVELRNEGESPKFGYTAGINACYDVSTHIGIEAGLQYSNKGYQYKIGDYLTFGDMIDPRYGYVYQTQSSYYTIKKFIYNYVYLDVPVRVIYSFGRKKIHFITSIGITTNILLKATQTNVLKYDDGSTKRKTSKQIDDYKTFNLSPTISAGVDYRINSKMNFRVEPTFRYGLLSIIDAPIKGYLWSGGLNITYYYALK